jgi:hypothetical protein
VAAKSDSIFVTRSAQEIAPPMTVRRELDDAQVEQQTDQCSQER